MVLDIGMCEMDNSNEVAVVHERGSQDVRELHVIRGAVQVWSVTHCCILMRTNAQ
ncbi:hypothetical protein PC129_g21070 [Phytophthora cactorum]|uniref:Uncharacterized protein n=1 Tax=Phytophthora cactorum TaxID=29920 RepID=A0A329R9Z2_9STRA|nr:hypothetical protein Pcac1_g26000 [Phytophthora cactorum]KAG2789396.1 hypothetical protein PC111_g24149 [Phytophthora cactorum]KAG2797741.1 hypothetical protein PC112_g21650 [Phytophthora cactorum]KAG2850074.1 hypothetical protein PC113_g17109 [Phytophthora cactorum]KAG2874082.1 hypothetical protein PC114_g25487 [Phytophthora cactorum]